MYRLDGRREEAVEHFDKENEPIKVLFEGGWCGIGAQDPWKDINLLQRVGGNLRSEVFEGLGKGVHIHAEKNVATTSVVGKLLQKMETYVMGHREYEGSKENVF